MIDLHMHSYYSDDGEFSPEELVEMCAARNLTHISITDHNCARANISAGPAAAARGIRYIPGIEIDCVYQGCNFHVLGYGLDYLSPEVQAIEDQVRSQSREASLKMLQLTQAMGFSVTEDRMHDLSKDTYWPDAWTGEMFAEILLADEEYTGHPLLLPYRAGGSRGDNPYVNFYWDLYAQGKPCYAEILYPQMDHVIDLIHQNHGLAVLAHPGVNLKGRRHLFAGIAGLGIDGAEVFSSYHSPAQAAEFYNEAKQFHLLTFCGSDFHGKIKPAIAIGGHGGPARDQELLDRLEKIGG